ncbi:trypsin-like serine protease [Amycolatopsis aidingensis]|uniref:trypsin-like serine protease n=1 Tax=Amycolatopsis aidingensis TaxID=2842453 RepID=UPI001C0CE76D|nr:trypsin-like serine protease [Amycolatopsis aidingensis]
MKRITKALCTAGLAAGLAAVAPPALADSPGSESPGATPQVINGTPATVDEFPFIISQHRTGGARETEQSCTGSVVAKRAVLIAAHCKFAQGEPKYLIYGRDDLANTGEGTRIEIAEYRVHPDYNPNDGWRTGHDVAVIFTETDIPTPEGMVYPEIADSGDSLPLGTEGTTIGYGMTDKDDNERNTQLYKTTLPTVDGQNCKNINFQYDPRYMMCSGYGDGRTGLCRGDSGGPWLHNGKIYGVFSWLRTDCASYDAHARMHGVLGDWANEQLGNEPPDDPPGEGEEPTASFTVQCQGLDCSFDGTRSTDPDGTIASYAWNFGDGTTGNGPTTTHTYPSQTNNYTATLTVTDNNGNTATTNRTIQCWSFSTNQGFCFSS